MLQLPRATLLAIVVVAVLGTASTRFEADGQPSDDTAAFNARLVSEVAKSIRGREQAPAREVFKNLRIAWLADGPADTFLDIMESGYSRALGVRCTHCHVEGDFASDDKRPKRAAREMAAMHRAINRQLLAMKHLKGDGDERFINCATCHRGAVDPHDARDSSR
jgi:hypothetical protein